MKTSYYILFILCLFLTVSCSEDKIEPNISLETTGDITIDSQAGAEATVRFTSSAEWQASTTSDWFTYSPSSGDGGTFDISVTAKSLNNTGSTRLGTLILTSGTVNKKITLKQEVDGSIQVEQNSYNVSAAGENIEIRFSTNIPQDELQVYGSQKWLTSTKRTRTSSSYSIYLTVLPNTDNSSRVAYIYFAKGTGVEQKILNTVTITQQGLSSGQSTDYSADKKVRTLQTASIGSGIPIVLMGDGFIDKEIADGTYDEVMKKTLENLFSEEPIKSLRDYFSVYAVTAVSKNNSFGSGNETAFSCVLAGGNSTGITGDQEAVVEYLQSVRDIDWTETLAVVILNTHVHAGTTYFNYFTTTGKYTEFAIAYCPVIANLESENFRQVLVHEAIGHGFGKLDDEYSYAENGAISAEDIKATQNMQTRGWMQNVDFTSDRTRVLWNTFLTDTRYSSENLGVFEGASTYIIGAYRPSEDSMMNSNTTGFNAPSRKALYDKVMKLGLRTVPPYEEFVVFDLQHRSRTRSVAPSFTTSGEPFTRPNFAKKTLVVK